MNDTPETVVDTNKSVPCIRYVNYQTEAQMPDIVQLVKQDLSEPYTVYTYRYFINNWGKLCFLAYDGSECVGAIVCKLDARDKRDQVTADQTSSDSSGDKMPQITYKGYIAMLVVKKEYRKMKIGSQLVKLAVNAMKESKADEIVLETEVTNKPALKLYENLGFLRDKRLFRYYLSGLDALRLKLWIV
jgi:peptide alpha-N-acetyltransferase